MPPKKKAPQAPQALDLPDAPMFHPTAEQWKDPLRYVSEVVRPSVEHTAGICRVVPPPAWVEGLSAQFAVDRATLRFNARVQRVDQLQRKHTAVASQRFWNEYHAWMAANGVRRKGGKINPVFNGQEIELDRFHSVVARRGGYQAVAEERSWREVANVLDLEDKAGNAAFTLRKLYEKLLRPFDEHCEQRAEGGYGLLAAALKAEVTDIKSDPLEDADTDEDEAAEILSAMLGLAPPEPKKRRKSGGKVTGKGSKGAASPSGPALSGAAGTATKQPSHGSAASAGCEKCKGGHMAEKMVQCDRCDKAWHLFCLAPPLAEPPAGEWVCPDCRSKEFETFAFQDADDYTLEEFEGIAATFEEQWFGEEAAAKLTYKEKEAEFWRIVEDGEDVVEVLYGADLDSGEVGSGFPRAPPLGASDSPYATDPWNLSVLPRQAGRHSSLLRVLDGNIAGVTVPWVYVGMCFSSFCWHVEDHMFYSINYNHWGAPKQWYGVPAWAAAKFEAVFRSVLADQVATQPDLLFQLLSMLSPRVLRQHGVPVYSATQAVGEFVITFPNAYHGGFCLGVNLGEAVNFAPADWLRFGAAALARLRHFRKPCVVSQEEMVLRVAHCAQLAQRAQQQQQQQLQAAPAAADGQGEVSGGGSSSSSSGGEASPLACYYLRQELRRLADEEWVLRGRLWSEGLRRSHRVELAVGFEDGDVADAECAICHLDMHLSAVECECCPGRRVCLHHAAHLCGCHMGQRRLLYRHTLRQLEAVHTEIAARVPADVAAELDAVEAASAARTAAAAAAGAAAAAAAAAARTAKPDPEQQEQQEQQAAVIKAEDEQQVVPAAAAAAAAVAGAGGGEDDKAAAAGLQEHMTGAAAAAQQDGGQQKRVSGNQQQEEGQQQEETHLKAEAGTGGQLPAADPEAGAAEAEAALEQQPVEANASQQDGPVRPFVSPDLCPWDRAELPEWQEALRRACQQWQLDATEALAQGGAKAELLEDLAEESEQYLWGDVDEEVAELAGRVRVAAAYMARISAALRDKQGMEEVQAIVAQDPKPVPDPPGLQRLEEGLALSRDWLARAQAFLDEGRGSELKALEGMASEANRLPVALPEAKLLRERATAARKLADAVRGALPTARDSGRRRGTEQLALEELQQLQEQAEALRVDMPEMVNLSVALERVVVWQSRVKALTAMQAPLGELRELLEESEALPAAMPEVESIKALIERGEAWKRQMEAVVRNRSALKKMREVLNAGCRLPVELPEIEQLRQEIRRREWEEATRKSLNARQNTLAALAELLGTAGEVGAEQTPLAQGLREKVEVAEAWEARAADLLDRQSEDLPESERPTLEAVHHLVGEGLAVGIKMDRLSQLSSQMTASASWMEEARHTLSKAAGGQQQQGQQQQGAAAAASAAALGGGWREESTSPMEVEEGSQQQQQQQQAATDTEGGLSAAAGASESAAPSAAASAAVSQGGSPEPEGGAAAEAAAAEAAAAEAAAEAAVEAAAEAAAAAALSAFGGQRQQQGTPSASLPPPPLQLPPLPAIPKARRRGRQPKAKLKQAERRSSHLPELNVIEGLLADYKTLLVRADEEAAGLRRLRAVADGWLEEARPVLEQEFVTDGQLGLLGSLIASGEQLGLAIEQVDILKANVEALLWARKVRALLAKLPPMEGQQQEQQQQQEEEAQPEAMETDPRHQEQQQEQQQQEQQQPADAAAADAEEGEAAAEAAVAEVQQRLLAAVEAAAAGHPLQYPSQQQWQQAAAAAAAAAALQLFERRPPLKAAVSLLEEGHILPCDEKLYTHLRSYVEAGQEFEARTAQVLALARDGVSFAHPIEADALQPMLEAADRLCLRLASLPILQDMLAAFRQWEAELRAITQDAGGGAKRAVFADLQAASGAARAWPITSPLRAFADEAVTKTGDWMERCRKMLAKRNTGARLEACLEALAASVDAAVEQFERRLDAEKRLVASGGGPAPVAGEDDKERYCLCQHPYHSDTTVHTMISCDACGEWFHARCVGVNQSQMRSMKRYNCPICTAIKGNVEPLDLAVSKLQRTKRPEREDLAALLPELEAMSVRPSEGEQLERLVKKFDRWGTATSRAVEVHELSRNVDSGGQILPLSEGMLHQLLKSALALEIDATEYAQKVLRLLRCNKWRVRAEQAMGPPAKQGLDGMQKLLAEGQKLDINVQKDVAGSRLLSSIESGRAWAERAKACIAELKAAGEDREKFEAVAQAARGVVREGQALPVRMDAEVEQLQEHSKLYCLCKKQYDELRPMVGCDFCQDWYHHECVGLRAPGGGSGGQAEGEVEGDEPPDSFRCPLCCMRLGVKYAHFHKLPEGSLDALKEAALKLPPAPLPPPPPPPPAPVAPARLPSPPQQKHQQQAQQQQQQQQGAYPGVAWPGMPAGMPAGMAASMAAAAAAGMRPAGMMPPGMSGEQVAATISHMFRAGAFQGLPAMMPGLPPGMGLFGMPPQLIAALQQQRLEQQQWQQQEVKQQARAAKRAAAAKQQEQQQGLAAEQQQPVQPQQQQQQLLQPQQQQVQQQVQAVEPAQPQKPGQQQQQPCEQQQQQPGKPQPVQAQLQVQAAATQQQQQQQQPTLAQQPAKQQQPALEQPQPANQQPTVEQPQQQQEQQPIGHNQQQQPAAAATAAAGTEAAAAAAPPTSKQRRRSSEKIKAALRMYHQAGAAFADATAGAATAATAAAADAAEDDKQQLAGQQQQQQDTQLPVALADGKAGKRRRSSEQQQPAPADKQQQQQQGPAAAAPDAETMPPKRQRASRQQGQQQQLSIQEPAPAAAEAAAAPAPASGGKPGKRRRSDMQQQAPPPQQQQQPSSKKESAAPVAAKQQAAGSQPEAVPAAAAAAAAAAEEPSGAASAKPAKRRRSEKQQQQEAEAEGEEEATHPGGSCQTEAAGAAAAAAAGSEGVAGRRRSGRHSQPPEAAATTQQQQQQQKQGPGDAVPARPAGKRGQEKQQQGKQQQGKQQQQQEDNKAASAAPVAKPAGKRGQQQQQQPVPPAAVAAAVPAAEPAPALASAPAAAPVPKPAGAKRDPRRARPPVPRSQPADPAAAAAVAAAAEPAARSKPAEAVAAAAPPVAPRGSDLA